MPRRKREDVIKHPEEPDLAPFMNLVIILIPMLLLSVVFLEVAVINVTMPIGGTATQDEDVEGDGPELDLTINVGMAGFWVQAYGEMQSPIDGCPSGGPTVCLEDDWSRSDVEAAFEDARRISLDDEEAGEEILRDALTAFRWRELYNLLAGFKAQEPEETTFKLGAHDDAPFALTVRTMDVARYQLEEEHYDDDREFWTADPQWEDVEGEDARRPVNMFGDPAFTVMQ